MTHPVGTIVKLKLEMLGNPKDSLGVAFNDYGDGTQFIFANGNYDGFSIEEQEMFVEHVGFDESVAKYKFTNVIQLSNDFASGMFNTVFVHDKFLRTTFTEDVL
jgi:hypothetical protein